LTSPPQRLEDLKEEDSGRSSSEESVAVQKKPLNLTIGGGESDDEDNFSVQITVSNVRNFKLFLPE